MRSTRAAQLAPHDMLDMSTYELDLLSMTLSVSLTIFTPAVTCELGMCMWQSRAKDYTGEATAAHLQCPFNIAL